MTLDILEQAAKRLAVLEQSDQAYVDVEPFRAARVAVEFAMTILLTERNRMDAISRLLAG